MYYSKGAVVLEHLQLYLAQLQKLLVEVSLQANQFRKDICKYNRVLAFISISYNKNKQLNSQGSIQCFQIHSKLFHFQGPLQPENNIIPSFVQFFFYNLEFTIDLQIDKYSSLDYSILVELLQILIDYNLFISLYKTIYKHLREYLTSEYQIVWNLQIHLVIQIDTNH